MSLKILDKKDLKNSVGVVIGTRPGIVKFAPVIKELQRRKTKFFLIHAGQHYSYNMDKTFIDQLDLPQPKYTNDNVRRYKSHGGQTAEMIKGIEKAVLKEKPKLVIVGGDANTNLAGALAVRKLGIYLAHMEAGLRSHDWSMPEEHNRIMIDHISEVLLAPTKAAKENLKNDNVKGKIYLVGNVIADSVKEHSEISEKQSSIMDKLKLKSKEFFLLTCHREENVDSKKRLKKVVKAIKDITKKYDYRIIFPLHPRTKKRLEYFGLDKDIYKISNLKIIKAVGYFDFLNLLKNCKLVLTDSGGIQEEACILKVPCVTLRDNTERPETVEVGANIISSVDSKKVDKAINYFLSAKTKYNWKNPFGSNVAKKIADVLESYLEKC